MFDNEKYPHGFFAPNRDPRTNVDFRGGKGNLYEGGLRVAFMVRWPGHIPAGSVSDHLGYFPDVLPTLADLAGAAKPADIDGISFLPTLLGSGPQEEHEGLYWEFDGQVAVREGDWKAFRLNPDAPFELYDLSTDISEQSDVAAEHPEVLERLVAYARREHAPEKHGTVYDPSLAFKGHEAK